MLLRRLREQGGELLQGSAAPGAGVGVEREVEPGGGERGVADPVRHRGLHGDVLEVGGPRVERDRQLPVVNRNFGQCRAQRPEPEAQARAVVGECAALVVTDVGGGRGAQMVQSEASLDVGHDRYPLNVFVMATVLRSVNIVKVTIKI